MVDGNCSENGGCTHSWTARGAVTTNRFGLQIRKVVLHVDWNTRTKVNKPKRIRTFSSYSKFVPIGTVKTVVLPSAGSRCH